MSTLSATYRSRQKVLGYPVDIVDEPLALEIIEEAWKGKRGLHIVTLNAEMVIAAQQDQSLDRIVRHAHLIVPDGAGVVAALRLGGHKINRLPGIESGQCHTQSSCPYWRHSALDRRQTRSFSQSRIRLADTASGSENRGKPPRLFFSSMKKNKSLTKFQRRSPTWS